MDGIIFKIRGTEIILGKEISYIMPEFEILNFVGNKVLKMLDINSEGKLFTFLYSDQNLEIFSRETKNPLMEYSVCHQEKEKTISQEEMIDLMKNENLIFISKENNRIKLTKYIFKGENSFIFNGSLFIETTENGFNVYDGNEKVDYNNLVNFVADAVIQNNFEKVLQESIFNIHIKTVEIAGIKQKYYEFMKKIPSREFHFSNSNLLFFYENISTKRFDALFEFNVKNGIDANFTEIINSNPLFTGKEYKDVKTISKLSSVSMEFVKLFTQYRDSSSDEIIDVFYEMEQNPKIGVNGIKYIQEVNSILKDIRIETPDTYNMFYSITKFSTYKKINEIVKTFNVSIKTFIDRAIRANFYEGCDIPDYIDMTYDYIQIKKTIGLNIEDKMPSNIIELHDSLINQLKSLREKEKEVKFRKIAQINKVLSDNFIKDVQDDYFTIIAPEVSNDLIKEGQNMHNCVGSYIDRMINGYSKIYFVRKKDNPDISFATIELDKQNNLIQAKARFNEDVDKKTNEFVEKFIEYVGGKIYD